MEALILIIVYAIFAIICGSFCYVLLINQAFYEDSELAEIIEDKTVLKLLCITYGLFWIVFTPITIFNTIRGGNNE